MGSIITLIPLKINDNFSPDNLEATRAPIRAPTTLGTITVAAVARSAFPLSANCEAPRHMAHDRDARLVPCAAICDRPIRGWFLGAGLQINRGHSWVRDRVGSVNPAMLLCSAENRRRLHARTNERMHAPMHAQHKHSSTTRARTHTRTQPEYSQAPLAHARTRAHRNWQRHLSCAMRHALAAFPSSSANSMYFSPLESLSH